MRVSKSLNASVEENVPNLPCTLYDVNSALFACAASYSFVLVQTSFGVNNIPCTCSSRQSQIDDPYCTIFRYALNTHHF